MKTIMTLIILILVTALTHLAVAQSQTPLICKGDIETTKDGVKDLKPLSVDILLDLHDATVEINGYWGCLADVGDGWKVPPKYKCLGKMPVIITDSEIKFTAQSAGDKFEGFSGFTINRYSGSMSISSIATAKPAAEAKWVLITISAKLQCVRPEKQF